MRARDKRTQRLDVVAAKHSALEPTREVWDAAPEWWRDYYTHRLITGYEADAFPTEKQGESKDE